MDKLISGFKRGKYLQGLLNKTMKDYQNSEESLEQAVLMKYHNVYPVESMPLSVKLSPQFLIQILTFGYLAT